MIKLVIIEDHSLMRLGLRQILEKDPSIEIAGEAGTGLEGIKMVRSLQPDVVLLDINLPDISGLEVTNKLIANDKEYKILIITALTNELYPIRLLEAGARGYITKNTPSEELIDAIKTVNKGKSYISHSIAQKLAITKLSPRTDQFASLSDREMEVMEMVLRNNEPKIIAKKLNISTKTVHSYRSRLFEKLEVKNNLELLVKALKYNVITIDETNFEK